eukprot:9653867-Alexandrium_andersonii.AAC.1
MSHRTARRNQRIRRVGLPACKALASDSGHLYCNGSAHREHVFLATSNFRPYLFDIPVRKCRRAIEP